jgi:hypothetical protein
MKIRILSDLHLEFMHDLHSSEFVRRLPRDFFLCDVRKLIETAQPALWIHGHTHESCDYQIGRTRVVCNPYGYAGHEVNRAFDPGKCVEL